MDVVWLPLSLVRGKWHAGLQRLQELHLLIGMCLKLQSGKYLYLIHPFILHSW